MKKTEIKKDMNIQVSWDIHRQLKMYCANRGLLMKSFVEKTLQAATKEKGDNYGKV